MNKKILGFILAIVLVSGVICGVTLSSKGLEADASGKPVYPVNQNGETYGTADPRVRPELQEYPDLIYVKGEDGVFGYIRRSEAEGEQPKTPEEAVLYMERKEAEREAARAAGQEYRRYVPIYEEDGLTIIGRFGIDWLGTDEPTYEIDVK